MNIKDEPPHFITDAHDGRSEPVSYWRQFLFCSDGRCVIGCGNTSEAAAIAAAARRDLVEQQLALDPWDQIESIINTEHPGCSSGVCPADQERILLLLWKIVKTLKPAVKQI